MAEQSFQWPGRRTSDPAHDMLVAFLVMDIQRNPDWAHELADRIEQVKTGKLPVWERIGNAYRRCKRRHYPFSDHIRATPGA